MSHRVFFSYAIQDRELAELVKSRASEFLRHANPDLVEITDEVFVKPGSDVRASIRSAIDTANTVVVIASKHSDKSPWVNYEVGLADAMGKKLVIIKTPESRITDLQQRFADTAQIINIDNG